MRKPKTIISIFCMFVFAVICGTHAVAQEYGIVDDRIMDFYKTKDYQKAPELLAEIDASPEFVHAVCCHGYGICVDLAPEHEMEKVLYAADELTGLIGAATIMRPSKSTKDMEVKSLKKKFKDKKFAAGCSREIITNGAEILGWELSDLMEKTILAMRSCEDDVRAEYSILPGQEV